jgi:hypothetical protein
VLGIVLAASPDAERRVQLFDPRGPIGRHLLANCEVQPEVQERIHLSALGREFGTERCIAGLEPRVILRMLRDHRRDLPLQGLERLAAAEFPPGGEIHPAQLVPRLAREHQLNTLRRGAFFSGAGVFGSNSHRSRITHSGQPGLRARQT